MTTLKKYEYYDLWNLISFLSEKTNIDKNIIETTMFYELKQFAYFGQQTLITLNIKEELNQIETTGSIWAMILYTLKNENFKEITIKVWW